MENKFLEGLDALFAINEIEQAGEYLVQWYEKAVSENDWRLLVTVLNEMMGYYRSIGDESHALDSVEKMLKLIKEQRLSDNPDIGTVWINVGTTLCRFYKHEEGLKYYKMAEEALKNCDNDYVLASLYNNSAAAHEANEDFNASIECYKKSLQLLKKHSDCITFVAITYANMANCYIKTGDEENGRVCLEMMDAVLEDENIPRDAGYASACVKCGSLHYNIGNMERAGELNERAKEIYKGNIL